MNWKPAKKKLTKSQKRRGKELREEIEWLENKLSTHQAHLQEMKSELNRLYAN